MIRVRQRVDTDVAQEAEFARRLEAAIARAQALLFTWPLRPTWWDEAVLGLLQRSVLAAQGVQVLYKADCCPDMATVGRVAFEPMITALYILNDPNPQQRAREYTRVMLWGGLVERRHDLRDLGIKPTTPTVGDKPTIEWLEAELKAASAGCKKGYRATRPRDKKQMCEVVGLKRLYTRCYRPLCTYAHPDPMIAHRLFLGQSLAATVEHWPFSAMLGLAVSAGSMEVLNNIVRATQNRTSDAQLRSAWPSLRAFVDVVFPATPGRLLGPPPA